MGDSYQAVYDATRSRISSCDVGAVIRDVAFQSFDFSHARAMLQEHIFAVGCEMARPSVVFRPKVFVDGNHWCALYGENLQEGVCGFGDSPEAACAAFDKAWHAALPQKAA